MTTLCSPIHRDKLYLQMAKQELSIAMVFPKEDPPGWYVGTLKATPRPRDKDTLWLNFSEGEKKAADDVLAILSSLNHKTYNVEWALLCKQGMADSITDGRRHSGDPTRWLCTKRTRAAAMREADEADEADATL